MKRIIILICFFFTAASLTGVEYNKFENYLIIKYLIKTNEINRAEALIERFLSKNPDDPFVLTEKSFILKNFRNKGKEALEYIRRSKEI